MAISWIQAVVFLGNFIMRTSWPLVAKVLELLTFICLKSLSFGVKLSSSARNSHCVDLFDSNFFELNLSFVMFTVCTEI